MRTPCLMSRSSDFTSTSVRHSTLLELFTYVLWIWVDEGANTTTQRYLLIKSATPEERKKFVKKVVFFAGKAAPGCTSIIHLLYFPWLIFGPMETTLQNLYARFLISSIKRVVES